MNYRVVIDPGHGGSDPGASNAALLLLEKTVNLAIALSVRSLLVAAGVEVYMTRETDIRLNEQARADCYARADFANDKNPHAFVSIHCNSATVTSAHGTETWIRGTWPTENDRKLGQAVQAAIVQQLQRENRGVKEADYWVLDRCGFPACIIELAFINNPEEGALLASPAFQERCARGIAQGIADYLGISIPCIPEPLPEQPAPSGTPILATPSAKVGQGKAWAQALGATDLFVSLADIFWRMAPEAGVDPVVAYCQSAKETGYGKFGGVLDASYCNPCGMKTSTGGGDYDPSAHQRFTDWEQGIRAQVDHLALYAGQVGYPRADTSDPRHFAWIAGKAPTIEALGGAWAPSAEYGTSIVTMMINLQNITVPEAAPSSEDPFFDDIAWAQTLGISDGSRPNEPAERREVIALIRRAFSVLKDN